MDFKITFENPLLKRDTKYLLGDCFVFLRNVNFRQVTWIATGSDPAIFMTNFFLYFFENKWMLSYRNLTCIKHVISLI